MEKIHSAALYFYNVTPTMPNTFRISFRLCDAVDADAMLSAVQTAQKRYPYFCKKVVRTEKEYLLDENPLPWVLRNTDKPFPLACGESNGHLLAFSFSQDWFYINVFHGFADGAGIFPVIGTVFYYYIKARYGEDLASPFLRDIHSAPSAEEINDPVVAMWPASWTEDSDEPLEAWPDDRINPPAPLRITEMGVTRRAVPKSFKFTIPGADLMRYCKRNDGSPATALALLIARAMDRAYPDSGKEIVAGIATNQRAALRTPTSHHSTVHYIRVPYGDKMRKYDFERQGTFARGRVMIDSDPLYMREKLARTAPFYKHIEQLPTLAEKQDFVQETLGRDLRRLSLAVSYVGKSGFGAMENYIAENYVDLDAAGTDTMTELNFIGETFFVNFMQEWEEDNVFTALLEELTANGIRYTRTYTGDCLFAGMKMN